MAARDRLQVLFDLRQVVFVLQTLAQVHLLLHDAGHDRVRPETLGGFVYGFVDELLDWLRDDVLNLLFERRAGLLLGSFTVQFIKGFTLTLSHFENALLFLLKALVGFTFLLFAQIFIGRRLGGLHWLCFLSRLHVVFLTLDADLLLLVTAAHEGHIALIAALFEHCPALDQQLAHSFRCHFCNFEVLND